MKYNYIITYVPNAEAFIAELETMAPTYVHTDETTGDKKWVMQHTPIVKNENGSLAMSVLTDEELAFIATMTTMKSLGTYEELFANSESLALYKSVYDYETPIIIDGVEHYKPMKIGEFAR